MNAKKAKDGTWWMTLGCFLVWPWTFSPLGTWLCFPTKYQRNSCWKRLNCPGWWFETSPLRIGVMFSAWKYSWGPTRSRTLDDFCEHFFCAYFGWHYGETCSLYQVATEQGESGLRPSITVQIRTAGPAPWFRHIWVCDFGASTYIHGLGCFKGQPRWNHQVVPNFETPPFNVSANVFNCLVFWPPQPAAAKRIEQGVMCPWALLFGTILNASFPRHFTGWLCQLTRSMSPQIGGFLCIRVHLWDIFLRCVHTSRAPPSARCRNKRKASCLCWRWPPSTPRKAKAALPIDNSQLPSGLLSYLLRLLEVAPSEIDRGRFFPCSFCSL